MAENVNIKKDLSFDSSLSSIDIKVTTHEYRERLVTLLQPILDNRFPGNSGKQRIRPYNDRITFACPYCGDSMKSNHKKRGNFILKGKFQNYFKCHNCDEFKRIDHFFSDFNVQLELDVINYIGENLTDFSSYTQSKYDMSLFIDMGSIDKYAIDRQEFLKYFGLIEVKESPVWSWLKHRLQFDNKKFMYNSIKNYVVVLNLTPSGRILGLQKRNFKGENKYLTYKLSKLYELMKKTEVIPEEIDAISQLFNICLVNYNKPITLFEGPMDSFLFRNSIGNTGAGKNFPIDIPVRYWFDDDKKGREKSIEKISDENEVFLWTKLKNDIDIPYRNKWDLNDLLMYLNENHIKVPNFDEYFSNDELDMIDI